jgi:hypothetical protein
VLYLRLIIFSVGGDVPVNSKTFLVTDFVNLKVKSAQSFECVHRNIYVCTVFLKKEEALYVTLHLAIRLQTRDGITHLPKLAKSLNPQIRNQG